MDAVVWSGAATGSDVFLLIAAIVAGLAALIEVVVALSSPTGLNAWVNVLVPAAVSLIALGLLAL